MRKTIGLLAVSVCTVWAGSAFAQGQIAPTPNPAGSTITLSSSGWFNNAIFDNRGTLNNNVGGTLDNSGLLISFGALNNDALLHNNGTLGNNDSGTLSNFGTLNNNGSLGNSGTLTNSGTLNNNVGGTLDNYDSGTLSNFGTLSSTGTLTNSATMTLASGVVNATSITNNGTFNLNGGALNVDTFNGNLDNTGGTLGAGNLSSFTTINGDYSQDANSTLLIESLGVTGFGALSVSGTATLNGELKFVGSDYAGLALGDSFDILIANAIVGEFASVSNRTINEDWMWKLDYGLDGSSVTATVSAVPLPAAAWLFISAIAGLAGAKRMSRSKGAA